jgi:predicted nucleic acid-binding protein
LISAITEFEFLIGSTLQNRQFTGELLARLPVLPFDSACVKTASEIYRDLKAKNQLISLPDIFIAATAITYDLQLVTLIGRPFQQSKRHLPKTNGQVAFCIYRFSPIVSF